MRKKTHAMPMMKPPMPQESLGSRFFWVFVFVGLAGLVVYLTWSVISVLAASVVLAYLADPLLRRLEQRGFSRSVGSGMLALFIGTITLLILTILVPIFVNQIQDLSVNVTPYIDSLQARIGPMKADLESRYGVVLPVDLNDLAGHIPQYLQQLSPNVRTTLSTFLQQLAGGGLGFIIKIVQISLLFPFTYYLAVDWPRLMSGALSLVPPRWHPIVTEISSEIDERIGAFVRGQIIVCAVLGVLYSLGLMLTGIDLAGTIGLLSGALFIVPYLGTLVGIVLSCTLALLKFGFDWHVLGCIATFVIVQGIEGTFLTPYLVGDRVGLHPMVVIVALLVGGDLLGIWGVLLAVPITASLAVLLEYLVARYRQSRLFTRP